MSIAQALGYTDEKIFRRIPEGRIRHIGKHDNEPIEISSAEVHILQRMRKIERFWKEFITFKTEEFHARK